MNENRPDAWQRWHPTDAEPWDLRGVWGLHRRCGFAATWGELQRDLADGVEASVERVLSGAARAEGVPDGFDEMAETIGRAAVAAGNVDRLRAWWVYRMLFSPDPITERLTLMWHNHFATSNLKVDDVSLMARQNELLRAHSRGPFRELLTAVVKDPAVLVWLDAEANRKEHPNENLGRELMELFTLGVGNYTETDVKEAARCLTGWTVVRGEFRDHREHHDDGQKTVLGRTGSFDGDDLLDLLLDQPATARRIAWRLCDTFLGENVASDADIDELGRGLSEHELDSGWGVETILRSRLFFSEANLGTRVSSPAEFVVGTVRALELFESPPSTLLLAEQIGRMGQELFLPPNVFGWEEGRAWINTRSLIARGNFAAALVRGELQSPVQGVNVLGWVTRHAGTADREETTSHVTRLLLGRDPGDPLRIQLVTACGNLNDGAAAQRMVEVLLASPAAQLC
ncbi:MAG: DUF1800 family protein [Planctomycetaceae bacterium]